MEVRVARVYEAPEPDDGARVLVDRLWPRGVTRDGLALTNWCRQVAPSDALRRWYSHDPDRFTEFAARYQAELAAPVRAAAVRTLVGLARQATLTLLTASREPEFSQAAVLAAVVQERAEAHGDSGVDRGDGDSGVDSGDGDGGNDGNSGNSGNSGNGGAEGL